MKENVAEMKEFFDSWIWKNQVVKLILVAAVAFVVVFVLLRVIKKIFAKYFHSRDDINIRYVEKILSTLIVLVGIFWVIMSSETTAPFGRMLFQSTAIIGAVAGLAAQPVISDMFCGLMISACKPFEIGDRIELDNGQAGIVRDITIRHVVLRGIDTVDIVIPNSRINAMSILNMSHCKERRSIHCRFSIGMNSNVERAMEVIQHAVMDSPYSVPGKTGEEGEQYGPVYFIAYGESSLTMATTVYYSPSTPTETVKHDINLRVKKALDQNGIEIPYPYINVIREQAYPDGQ